MKAHLHSNLILAHIGHHALQLMYINDWWQEWPVEVQLNAGPEALLEHLTSRLAAVVDTKKNGNDQCTLKRCDLAKTFFDDALQSLVVLDGVVLVLTTRKLGEGSFCMMCIAIAPFVI
jgi:hypothetical protein